MAEWELRATYDDWCNENNNFEMPFGVWVNTVWEDMI